MYADPFENSRRRRRRRRRPSSTIAAATAAVATTTVAAVHNAPRHHHLTTVALLSAAALLLAMRSAAVVVAASASSSARWRARSSLASSSSSSYATTTIDAATPGSSMRRSSSYRVAPPAFVSSSRHRACRRPASSSSSSSSSSHHHPPTTTTSLLMANPRKIAARIVRGRTEGGGGSRAKSSSSSSSSAAAATPPSPPSTRTADASSSSSDVGRDADRTGSVVDRTTVDAADGDNGVVVPVSTRSVVVVGGGERQRRRAANTGRLRLLPPLQPASEILSRASRRAYRDVREDAAIANARRRTQKRGAQTIDMLSQGLCGPLKETVNTYERELRNMHPFETVVMDLTVRARRKKDGLTLDALLAEIHDGRKELLRLSKDWIAKIKSSSSTKEAYECTEEAKESIGRAFLDLIDGPWTGITELQRSLRNAPVVRLDCPAVVLVGAPNVGKSSIVRAISSGTPEVNNYPFTTRGVTLGHVRVFWESEREVALGNVAGVSIPSERQLIQERLVKGRKDKLKKTKTKEKKIDDDDAKEENIKLDDGEDGELGSVEAMAMDDDDDDEEEEEGIARRRAGSLVSSSNDNGVVPDKIFPISQLCQIMDSPGVLRRDDGRSRNEMEELTLAAMAHLPTAVMYVMDLSGGAGDKCSSVEDQLVLRRELRARFPRRPWIDVVSKVDLGVVDGARERLSQILEAEGRHPRQQERGDGAAAAADRHFIELSIKEGQGVEELRQEVMRMLGEVRVVLDAMAASDERSARAV